VPWGGRAGPRTAIPALWVVSRRQRAGIHPFCSVATRPPAPLLPPTRFLHLFPHPCAMLFERKWAINESVLCEERVGGYAGGQGALWAAWVAGGAGRG